MPYGPVQAKLIHEVGTRAFLRIYWGDKECPNCNGSKTPGYHNAMRPLAQTDRLRDWELGGKPPDHPDSAWPTKCDHCGAAVPSFAEEQDDQGKSNGGYTRQVFHETVYNTTSGKPEPGNIYLIDWMHSREGDRCMWWDNCDGKHYMAICPNGHQWEITGRASNCNMKDERTHRCWVLKELSPGVFHVDKNGHTCSAGAGSIVAGDYHGFLQNGTFTAG